MFESSSNPDDVPVDHSTADESAIAPTDYISLLPATLNFAAGGPLTQTITISVKGDETVEWNEHVYVNLSNCNGCIITESQGIAYVKNDD